MQTAHCKLILSKQCRELESGLIDFLCHSQYSVFAHPASTVLGSGPASQSTLLVCDFVQHCFERKEKTTVFLMLQGDFFTRIH